MSQQYQLVNNFLDCDHPQRYYLKFNLSLSYKTEQTNSKFTLCDYNFCLFALHDLTATIAFPTELIALIMDMVYFHFRPIIFSRMCEIYSLPVRLNLTEPTQQFSNFRYDKQLNTTVNRYPYLFLEEVRRGERLELKLVNLVETPHSTGTYLLLGVSYEDPRLVHDDGNFRHSQGGLFKGPLSDFYYSYGWIYGKYIGCQKASSPGNPEFLHSFYQLGDTLEMKIKNESTSRMTVSYRKNGDKILPKIRITPEQEGLPVSLFPMVFDYDHALLSFKTTAIRNKVRSAEKEKKHQEWLASHPSSF